ncbi:MAG: nucleotide modification associated domain-containing protein [Prevotella sp.]
MRKTPVEAIQWNGDNAKKVSNFISPTTKSYCMLDDRSGNLNISYADLKGRKYKVVVPKFGWVVRDGKTLQFYKDVTFRKTFEEVQHDDCKGIDGEVMSNIFKEALALGGSDEFFKGFKDAFRAEPYKETLGAGVCITPAHIKIDNLYKGYEKTHEEVKLSVGLKEMASNKEKEYSHGKTKGIESDTFESVLDEMKELHAKKDKDYGSAFHKSFEEFGVTAGVVRLNDKMERVKSLVKNGKAEVKDESLMDTLKDMASYAVMLYVELKNKNA